VTWSLSPNVGTISSGGLYTAPSTIAANQTVTATATSAADNTKTASATVNLIQPVAVSLSPGSVNLQQGASQTFTPTVTGTANTAVTWSRSPSVGTVSTSGVYSLPALLDSGGNVTVTATSVAGTSKSCHATGSAIARFG
jgi:trimeric autotransporter adhesin